MRRRIDVRDDDVDRVADLDDLLGCLDALDREVGRVNEPVDPRLELDERAERLEAHDLARVPRADAYFCATCCHGSGMVALCESQILPFSSILMILTRVGLARLEDVARAVAAVVAHLLERDEPLDAADVDERAERNDAADDALDILADLELRERFCAVRLRLVLEHRPAREDDVATALGVLGDEERQALADEVREVGAQAQVDVRPGAKARRPSTSTSMPPLMTPVTSP